MSDFRQPSVASKLKEAGRHSIIYGLGSVAQSAVGFLLIPILTGALSRDNFGVYSLILMASTVSGAVFYCGMTSALPRSYFDYEAAEDRRATFTTAFVILAAGALAQILLGSIGSGTISTALFGSDRYADPIAWAFFGNALAFVNQFFFSYLRILRKSTISVIFSSISLPSSIGLTLFLLDRSPGELASPFEAIAATQLAIAVAFVGLFRKTAFAPRIKRDEISPLVAFGIASVVASFGNMLLDWADRIVIQRFLTLADVGIYSAGFRIGTLINVILVLPFVQIWSPMMMEYRAHANTKQLFTQIFSYFVTIGAIIIAGSSLFLGGLLPFLVRSGANSQLASVVLLIMLGCLAYGTTNIVAAGLFYERKVSRLAYVYYVVAGAKIAADLLVVPRYGIVGAATIAALAYALIPAGVYPLARRYFSFAIDWKRIAILAVHCGLPLAYGAFLASRFPIWLPVRIAWFALVCVLVYRMDWSAPAPLAFDAGLLRRSEKD